MKDKQKFISSVIVSLLAGFIYFCFGENLQTKFQGAINAAWSYESEQYFPSDCRPFNFLTKNFSSNELKKKKKFFLKKNNIDLKSKDKTVQDDRFLSDFIKGQASFKRAVADKNPDFTAELNQLIKNDEAKQSQKLKATKDEFKSGSEIADTKTLKTSNNLLHKNAVEFNLGNGFEYNLIIETGAPEQGGNIPKKKNIKFYKYNRPESNNTSPECNSKCGSVESKSNRTKSNSFSKSDVYTSETAPENVEVKIIYDAPESAENNFKLDFEETGSPCEDSDDGSSQ